MQIASVYLGSVLLKDKDWHHEMSFLQQLVSSEYHEAASRVFVDALITPILLENRMQVRLEEKALCEGSAQLYHRLCCLQF